MVRISARNMKNSQLGIIRKHVLGTRAQARSNLHKWLANFDEAMSMMNKSCRKVEPLPRYFFSAVPDLPQLSGRAARRYRDFGVVDAFLV
eukprot:8992547-Alexandrium_andersonii.AAC.1